jgi:shikimate dehydrogenase
VRLAVVGSPVAHSLSPVIHTAALAACGIAGSYVAIDCDAAGFRDVVASIRSGELDGCNVTMPHKRLAADLVDSRSALAERVGAVNTIVRDGEGLVGHNTDVVGIMKASEAAELPLDAPVLILGAGGAAAAAVLAYSGRSLTVSARRRQAAVAMIESVGVTAEIVDFGEPVPGAVVVNATPLGMHGEHLPEALLASASGLFEMPYASGTTPATAEMRRTDRPVAVGEDMLVAQALESFRLWTGCETPEAPVRAALWAHSRG